MSIAEAKALDKFGHGAAWLMASWCVNFRCDVVLLVVTRHSLVVLLSN